MDCVFFFVVRLILLPVLVSGDMSAVLEYYILEEVPSRSLVGNLVKDHLDRKFNVSVLSLLRFSFLTRPVGPSSDDPLFTIDEVRGVIRTADRLDREAICPPPRGQDECVVKFDVAVQPMTFFEIIKLRVKVLDINDNAPTFPRSSAYFELSETAEPGSSLNVPSAEDRDTGQNALCSYTLMPLSDLFELIVRRRSDGSSDLRLVLTGSLDREVVSGYHFVVVAKDEGKPQRNGTMAVNVTVTDANDNCPQFDNAAYEVRIAEDVPVATSVLTVSARDPDTGPNGDIRYSFAQKTTKEYGHVFGIDPTSGQIYTRSSLDHEVISAYKLYVVATDASGGEDSLSAHASVEVRVHDVNDNAPEITFSALTSRVSSSVEIGRVYQETDDVNGFVVYVTRSSPEGTFVAHASINDADSGANGRFDCTIVGETKRFELQRMFSNQFKIVTISRLDRSRRHDDNVFYDMRIVCQDTGDPRLSSQVAIRVTVVEENLHTPVFFQDAYKASVFENNPLGQTIVQVEATDEDEGPAGDVVFSLQETSNDLLTRMLDIDATSGVIKAKVAFDREVTPYIELVVLGHDRGFPVKSASVRVSIVILDVDDELPLFERHQYSFVVSEDREVGTEIGGIVAIDRDEGPFNGILYSLDAFFGESSTFGIEPSTGRITVLEPLDREHRDTYHLLGTARPAALHGDAGKVTSCNVNIYVDDVNDNAPVFEFPVIGNDTVTVHRSDARIGHVVAQLRARDLDDGDNGKVSYSVHPSTDPSIAQILRVDPSTGLVILAGNIESFEREDPVELGVMATDAGQPERSEISILRIVFTSDEEPLFPLPEDDFRSAPSAAGDSLLFILAFVLATLLVALTVVAIILYVAKRDRRFRKSRGSRPLTDSEQRDKEVGGATAAGTRLSHVGGSDKVGPAEEKQKLAKIERNDIEPSKRMAHGGCGGGGKPVVVFIKDLSEEGGSVGGGSDTNSDSGRGPSSEDGDTVAAAAAAAATTTTTAMVSASSMVLTHPSTLRVRQRTSDPRGGGLGGGTHPNRSSHLLLVNHPADHHLHLKKATPSLSASMSRSTGHSDDDPPSKTTPCHDLTQCPLRRSFSSSVGGGDGSSSTYERPLVVTTTNYPVNAARQMGSFSRQRTTTADLPFQADVVQLCVGGGSRSHQSKTAPVVASSVAKDLTYVDCIGFDSFVRSTTKPDPRCIRTSLHDLSSQYLTPGLAKVAHLSRDVRRLSRSHALEESDVLQSPGVFAYEGMCTQTLGRVGGAAKKHLNRDAETGGCRGGADALAYDTTRDTPV